MKACPYVMGEGNSPSPITKAATTSARRPRLQTLRDRHPAPGVPQILCLIENLLKKPFRSNKHEAQLALKPTSQNLKKLARVCRSLAEDT
jgi:hypothetical protein